MATETRENDSMRDGRQRQEKSRNIQGCPQNPPPCAIGGHERGIKWPVRKAIAGVRVCMQIIIGEK